MTRPQEPHPDLYYLFAPLKHARQDYMVEKAVEMGVGLLRPVLTQRTQTSRINSERMRAHAIEAAEQCGILTIPDIAPAIKLDALLATWDKDRLLVFCDEDAPSGDPLAELCAGTHSAKRPRPLAVLIGPEGGFDAKERDGASRLALRAAPAARSAHIARRHRRRRGSRLGPSDIGRLARININASLSRLIVGSKKLLSYR